MAGLKKHILFQPDNDCGGNKDNNCLNTFGLGRHGYLFLHEINEKMENDTGQNRTVAGKINPGDDKSHGNGAYKKVDHKQGIYHESGLIGPFDKKKGEVPERPYGTEDDRLPEPVHIASNRVFTITLPANFLQDRSHYDREKCTGQAYPCKGGFRILKAPLVLKRAVDLLNQQLFSFYSVSLIITIFSDVRIKLSHLKFSPPDGNHPARGADQPPFRQHPSSRRRIGRKKTPGYIQS